MTTPKTTRVASNTYFLDICFFTVIALIVAGVMWFTMMSIPHVARPSEPTGSHTREGPRL